ncbi:hypothetical protein [Burkholderia gladioli]|uniref:hypothetical protein n=1 Tax=Burkholderia gladioli TaxID=28095 RepID=UPI001EE643A2|nr:hypothetical protein [Burkholderia gladioli]
MLQRKPEKIFCYSQLSIAWVNLKVHDVTTVRRLKRRCIDPADIASIAAPGHDDSEYVVRISDWEAVRKVTIAAALHESSKTERV